MLNYIKYGLYKCEKLTEDAANDTSSSSEVKVELLDNPGLYDDTELRFKLILPDTQYLVNIFLNSEGDFEYNIYNWEDVDFKSEYIDADVIDGGVLENTENLDSVPQELINEIINLHFDE